MNAGSQLVALPMKTALFRAKTWAILSLAFLAAGQMERGACFARGADVPGPSELLQYIALLCLTGYWFDLDSRETGVLRVWDMWFFLYVAWPVVVPYYLVKTRGLKRTVVASSLVVLVYVGAFIAGVAICRALR